MERFGAISLLLIGLVWPCDGQTLKECLDGAATQAEITKCASEEAHRADNELNDVYQRLQAAVRAKPAFVEKVRAQERVWVAYRDAYIAAMYPAEDKQVAYGTIYPSQVNFLRAKLTRRQADALRNLLKQYSSSQ
jgi:uncharacterized protein YecT (DUF1311 family)